SVLLLSIMTDIHSLFHAHGVTVVDPLSLHDALPILPGRGHLVFRRQVDPELKAPHQAFLLLGELRVDDAAAGRHPLHAARTEKRSEEHTSELQSRENLVCRLLLEKKNTT